jgi:mannitol/fructose-specific phosphotransferase system IIA component (Ntr-type)
MRARTKRDAIEELLDFLIQEHEVRIFDRPDLLDALLTREQSLSTGLQDHIAFPHAQSESVDDLLGVLGLSPDGVPFESRDGKDAKIIMLAVIPSDQYREHVRTMAHITGLLADEDFRDRLVEAGRSGSPRIVIETIEGREGPEFIDNVE